MALDYPLLIDVSGWQTYPNTGYGTNFVKAKSAGAVGALFEPYDIFWAQFMAMTS